MKRYQIDPDIQICTFLRQNLLLCVFVLNLCFRSESVNSGTTVVSTQPMTQQALQISAFLRMCIRDPIYQGNRQHSAICACRTPLNAKRLKWSHQASTIFRICPVNLAFSHVAVAGKCTETMPIAILHGEFDSTPACDVTLREECIRLNSTHCTACGLAFAYLLIK